MQAVPKGVWAVWGESGTPDIKHVHTQQLHAGLWHGTAQPRLGI